MKKQNWLLNNLFLICAILWYLVAVLKFLNGTGNAMTWFCFGSCYLCIHAVQVNKRMQQRVEQEKNLDEQEK